MQLHLSGGLTVLPIVSTSTYGLHAWQTGSFL